MAATQGTSALMGMCAGVWSGGRRLGSAIAVGLVQRRVGVPGSSTVHYSLLMPDGSAEYLTRERGGGLFRTGTCAA